MYVIVLAESPREASAYAKEHLSKPKRKWRYATRAASIRGLRVAEIHELPGFAKRRDKHAINAELKKSTYRTKNFPRVYPFGEPEAPARPELRLSPDDDLGKDYPETRLPLEDALDEAYPEEVDTRGVPVTRQRRSRCGVCGHLVWNDEDPDHDPIMHAEAAVHPKPAPTPTDLADFFKQGS